jgi:PPM family protein phosphatase
LHGGGWQYIQRQCYIGFQDGNVAIFRGINQNLAGIGLSRLVQRYSRQKWQALVTWNSAEQQYHQALASYNSKKTKTPLRNNPRPAADAARCAPASAFGIPASALPGGHPPS